MSDIDERIAQMRSLTIFDDEGGSVIDRLKNTKIDGWEWSETNFPAGGEPYGMKKGEVIVAIRYTKESSNIAFSSNVLPSDAEHNVASANMAIQDLSDALLKVGIQSNVVTSDNDKKRPV